MFSFQKTLKCIFEANHRKEIIHKALGVWKNATYLGWNLTLSVHKSDQNVSAFIMGRTKKVKSEQLILDKSVPLKKIKSESKKEFKRSKSKKKRSKKKSKHSKKKSVVVDSVASTLSTSGLFVVFDSKAKQETITLSSGDSDNMGNVSSENTGPFTSNGITQNMQGRPWHCDSSAWLSGGGHAVGSEQPTNSELFVRDQNSVIFCSDREEFGASSTMCSQLPADSQQREKLKSLRSWDYTEFGRDIKNKMKKPNTLMFTLLSYNVLAQDLLLNHTYLYQKHQYEALTWEYRSELLLKEIQEANADIMCLQEVQASHLSTFFYQLNELGYNGIYKKRTGDNVDGVAIYYKRDVFEVVHHTTVEYYQPDVFVLDRHNVALIAKLAVKGSNQQIVIATTHLLFNPRRHDVKLAQIQMLLTEVERLAFQDLKFGTPVYWPVIITGDMNFEPQSGVYRFLTEGMFQYEGLDSRTLTQAPSGRTLSKVFLPRKLSILDTCQHWGLLCKRLIEELNHTTELKFLKIYNSDHQRIMRELKIINEEAKSFEDFVESAKQSGLINNFIPSFGASSIPPMPDAGFGTGVLTHNLNLQSVYDHSRKAEKQATTNQNRWVTVDYIFYSYFKNQPVGNLKLVGKCRLPNVKEAESIGPIPNMASPSDHYPLLAEFFLHL